jgi:hypothetical protein
VGGSMGARSEREEPMGTSCFVKATNRSLRAKARARGTRRAVFHLDGVTCH